MRDLLSTKSDEELKVRESPQLGVHVAGLTRHVVHDADAVERIIENGTGNRTVAATKYNSESSRSHAVFEMHIQQKYKDTTTGEDMQSRVKIALIDLAGSERSDKLGSVGKALQEGNNINKSLTVLGRCIKALVEKANKPKKNINVPFRESVLTWYLRESLSGNARTTMLACVSPAASNEEETLSTLRYAASAKQIKTAAKKSEDPLKAKVRELTGEVEKLKAMLAAGGKGGTKKMGKGRKSVMMQGALKGNKEDVDALHEGLQHLSPEEQEAYMKELEEQMALMGMGGFAAKKSESRKKRGSAITNDRDIFPQLSCLNKDELLSHAMVVPIKKASLAIGRSSVQDGEANDFEIDGMGMCEKHCCIERTNDGRAALRLLAPAAVVHINGEPVTGGGPMELSHCDRVILGPCRIVAMFLTQKLTSAERSGHNYISAFREFMDKDAGAARAMMSPKRQALLDQIYEVDGVMLRQANAIASELCTSITFTSQLLLGEHGFGKADLTLDDMLEDSECRLKICCVAGTKRIETHADVVGAMSAFQEAEISKALARAASFASNSEPGTPKSAGTAAADGREVREAIAATRVSLDRLLFEMDGGEFGDLLAEMKVMHSNLSALTGGIRGQDATKEVNDSGMSRMIHTVFEAVDVDQSGSIDRNELRSCIEKFNVNHDPSFFTHVLHEEGIKEDDVLNFEQFELFLVRFLQHTFYKKLETHVTNKQLFLSIGGRSMTFSHRGTLLEATTRSRLLRGGDVGGGGAEEAKSSEVGEGTKGEEESSREGGDDGQRLVPTNEDKEKASRAKKLGREAKQARMRQRMRQNAVVTNFITTIKGDLQKAGHDLQEIVSSDSSGDSKKKSAAVKVAHKMQKVTGGKRRKKKTERDIYQKLNDTVSKAIKDLEAQLKTTVMVSKERDQLEDYLSRMLAERDALTPDGGEA